MRKKYRFLNYPRELQKKLKTFVQGRSCMLTEIQINGCAYHLIICLVVKRSRQGDIHKQNLTTKMYSEFGRMTEILECTQT